jgi:arginine transport system substrate-binding protein
MEKKIWQVLLATVSTFWLSLALAATQGAGLRFATEATYPPFSFFNENNQISGFEIDLAKAICSILNQTCSFHHQAFESLILNLKFHRSDAIISGMDITQARAQQVAFTQPYYYNTADFMIINGRFQSLADLQQQRVGVQRGSTHQNYLLEQYPALSVVTYDSYQNALLDLHNGRVQALFADSAVAQYWLKQQPQLAQLGPTVHDPRYFGQGIAIAVRQEDTALLAQLNQALKTLEQQGELQAIHRKWFKSGDP